jgi:N-acetylneuraminic acid mutarotase
MGIAAVTLALGCRFPFLEQPGSQSKGASFAVEVRLNAGAARANRTLIDDENVDAVSVEVLNSDKDQIGLGNLIRGESYWSGTISVMETGSVTLKARAVDEGGVQLYFGSVPATLSGSNDPTVTIPVGRVCVWTQLVSADGPSVRYSQSAIYDGSGNMIVFGGYDDIGDFSDVWKYDLDAQGWTQLASVDGPVGRDSHTAIYDGSGHMIVFGGWDIEGNMLNDVWEYDITGETWTELAINPATSPDGRIGHSAIYDGSGHMIVFGGVNYYLSLSYNDVWKFDIANETWTQRASADPVPLERCFHSAIYDGNGNMIIFGGLDFYDVWQYNIGTETWTQLASDGSTSDRWAHSAIYDGNGNMVIFGGYGDDVWNYNLQNEAWTQLVSVDPPAARDSHSAIYDGSGNMIIFGGDSDDGYANDVWSYILPK